MCQRHNGDDRFSNYEYFLVKIKTGDILAWMQDYTREKIQEQVERRDNRDWNSRTANEWLTQFLSVPVVRVY
jgi:hypothetical protein